MAKWIRFTCDYDHRWPSRAVTAFKADMVCFVKDEVADLAIAKGKAEETEKPEDGDPNHVTTQSPLESPADEAYNAGDAAQATLPVDRGHEPLAQRDDADDVGAKPRVRVHVPPRKRQ
jgi:hypothetical protein